jgi:hypothetical protein
MEALLAVVELRAAPAHASWLIYLRCRISTQLPSGSRTINRAGAGYQRHSRVHSFADHTRIFGGAIAQYRGR